MKYYFKIGRLLVYNICNIIVWLFICWLHTFGPLRGKADQFYLFVGVFWSITAVLFVVRYYRLLKLAVLNKPILEVDEIGIFDCVKNIKYYWDDIDEIFQIGRILYIKTYDSEKYIKHFKNFLSRYYNYSRKEKAFDVNLDCLKVDIKTLLFQLDQYSIEAQEMEKDN